jgi:hypothetical protein
MGYAEIYRKRNAPWRRALRVIAFCAIVTILLYFSIQLLDSQSGLMMGGASAK